METVKLWVMSLTASAIISAVVLTLAPNGALEKSIKTVVSIFLITSMLFPLVKNEDINLSLDTIQNEVTENKKINETMATAFGNNLKNEIKKTLEKNEINLTNIEVKVNIDNNEITVEKIQVTVMEKDKENAKKVLENQLDLVAEIKGE